jgi:CheY-like chemotaxis protein
MPGVRILAVEDDDVVREALCSLFTEEGYETAAARNGSEALMALLEEPQAPMIVLLDLLMPTLNGEQLLRVVLHDPALRDHHAYIVHTANAESVTPAVTNLLENLDVPLLPKPFDSDALLSLVERAERRISMSWGSEPDVHATNA